MGESIAGLAGGRKIDFALIGHQESWRAAADVLAVLRGPQHTPLPDDEIKDILPWIPPRAVCHVEVRSMAGVKARGVYIDSFIPPDHLDAAFMHDNIARVRGAAAYAIKAGAKIVSLGGFSSILIEGNFDQLPQRTRYGLHHRQYVDRGFYRPGHSQDVRARRPKPPPIHTAHRGSHRRCGFRLCPLPGAFCEARAAQRPQPGAATQASRRARSRWSSGRDLHSALLRRARRSNLRGESGISFASVGPHRARRNRMRCGLPQESFSQTRRCPTPGSSLEAWARSPAE